MSGEILAAAMSASAPWQLDPPLLGTVLRCGVLLKQGDLRRVWKERLCVLTDRGELHYLRVPEGGTMLVHTTRAQRGRINCRASVVRCVDGAEAAAAAGGQAHCFGIQPASGTRRFLLAARTRAERDEWVQAVSQFGDGPLERPGSAPNAKALGLLFGQQSGSQSHRGRRNQPAIAETNGGATETAAAASLSPPAAESVSASPPNSARAAPPKSLVTLGVSQAAFDKFRGSEKLARSLGAFADAGAGVGAGAHGDNKSPGRSSRASSLAVEAEGANSAAAAAAASPAVAVLAAAAPAAVPGSPTPLADILAARDAAHLPLAHPSQSPSLGTLAGGGRVYWCGWMSKYGGSGTFASWQRRWFVLTGAGLLHYWTTPEALSSGQKRRGTIDANHALVRYADEKEHAMAHALTLHPVVPPGSRNYVLAADTLPEREAWVAALSHFGEGPAVPPPRAHGPVSDKARDVLFGGHKKAHHSQSSAGSSGHGHGHGQYHASHSGNGGSDSARSHSHKSSNNSSAALLDKLGTNQRTLDVFSSNPKAFARLGLFEDQAPVTQRGSQGTSACAMDEEKGSLSARESERERERQRGASASVAGSEMELTSFERYNTTGNRVPPGSVLHSGWVAKLGKEGALRSRSHSVTVRFAVLTADSLLYYPSATEPTPKSGVDLTATGLGVGAPLDTEDPFNPSSDAAVAAAYPAAFVVRPPLSAARPLRAFVFFAPSDAQRDRWIAAVQGVLDAHQAERDARAAAPPPTLPPRKSPGK